jgi:hypothetical protein
VTVSYGTEDGTAIAGSDYVAVSGTLTFPPGVTSQPVSVPILGSAGAPGKRFSLVLSGAVNAAIQKSQATATIARRGRLVR